MDIYISINNRERVVKLPHLPPELTISAAQMNETYPTTESALNLIGGLDLEAISFNSYLDDWSIVSELRELRKRKLPFRLIITGTPINLPVTIDRFECGMKQGKKIYYSIEFKEFRFK